MNELTGEKKSQKIGLIAAAIFHVVLAIILLSFSINSILHREIAFVADPAGSERLRQEAEQKEESIKQEAARQIDEQLSASPSDYKSIPVQRGRDLKDDRGTDVDELYKEADRVQQKLKEAALADERLRDNEVAVPSDLEELNSGEVYKGPSVLNWDLDGRQAFSLPIPVYKCEGGGDVTVQISVGRNGYVKSVAVVEAAVEKCIIEAALSAAKRSRFSVSDVAPNPQIGQITYRFIAQ